MSRWYRVFGATEQQPPPERVLEQLRERGIPGPAHFRGDEDGWTALQIVVEGNTTIVLDCYLASEKGIRAELNTWAAEVETREDCPQRIALMERIIQTKQWYTMECPPGCEELAMSMSRFLARETEGLYQVDEAGFFEADGTLLLPDR